MRQSTRRSEITVLSFSVSFLGPLSQWKRYETLNGTHTRKDDLLFTSMIDPLFSYLLSMVGSRRIYLFFLYIILIFCDYGLTGTVKMSGMFL